MVLSGLTSLFADEENDNEEQRLEFASDDQEHSDELLRQLLNGDFDEEGKEHLTNKNEGEHSRQADGFTLAESDTANQDDFDISLLMNIEAGPAEQDISAPTGQDIMKVSVADFSPDEDLFVIEYDASAGEPEIELFGDPSGNSLVYCNGECVLVMTGGDGILELSNIELGPLS